jgi:hypothetical protein
MTEDEIKVLNYVDHGLGGPAGIVSELKPIYRSLIDRGFVQQEAHYVLTILGRQTLESILKTAEGNQK